MRLSWREPSDAKGPFTATPIFAGPFKIEAKPFALRASLVLKPAEPGVP
jgi:hypothetical protein